MEASIVELRYRMKDVLKALDRREAVKITYHGQIKGTIVPEPTPRKLKVIDHPFFGSSGESGLSVDEVMNDLRKGRFHDL